MTDSPGHGVLPIITAALKWEQASDSARGVADAEDVADAADALADAEENLRAALKAWRGTPLADYTESVRVVLARGSVFVCPECDIHGCHHYRAAMARLFPSTFAEPIEALNIDAEQTGGER